MKEKFEILNFSPEYIPILKEAIINVIKKTGISNNSVHIFENGEVHIYATRALFLINIGQEYQKLITKNLKK